eukprot:scaffold20564_cov84-Isochrysis_galbana.AAC.1
MQLGEEPFNPTPTLTPTLTPPGQEGHRHAAGRQEGAVGRRVFVAGHDARGGDRARCTNRPGDTGRCLG